MTGFGQQALLAYGYARVSTEDQAQDDRTSLDEQERKIREEAARRGWHLVRVFREEGVSGDLTERAELDAMLTGLRAGHARGVIVAHSDRLARDEIVRLLTLREFETLDVLYVPLDLPAADYRTEEGELVLGLVGQTNRYDKRKQLRKLANGLRGKAGRGGYSGGHIPVGWGVAYDETITNPRDRARSGRFVPEPAERAWLVPAIDHLIDDAWGLRRTARWLEGQGVRDRAGRVITPDALNRVMRGRTLYGAFGWSGGRNATGRYGGELVYMHPEPVISEARFEQLRAAIGSRHRAPEPGQVARVYLLSGRFASACGRTLGGWYRKDRDQRLYRCAGRKRAPACGCPFLPADSVEQRVAGALRELLNRERLLELADAYLGLTPRATAPGAEGAGDLAQVQADIERLQRRLERDAAEWLREGVSAAVVAAGSQAIERDLEALHQRQRAIEAARAAAGRAEQVARSTAELAELAAERLANPTPERVASLLALLRVQVTARPDGSLLIEGSVPLPGGGEQDDPAAAGTPHNTEHAGRCAGYQAVPFALTLAA